MHARAKRSLLRAAADPSIRHKKFTMPQKKKPFQGQHNARTHARTHQSIDNMSETHLWTAPRNAYWKSEWIITKNNYKHAQFFSPFCNKRRRFLLHVLILGCIFMTFYLNPPLPPPSTSKTRRCTQNSQERITCAINLKTFFFLSTFFFVFHWKLIRQNKCFWGVGGGRLNIKFRSHKIGYQFFKKSNSF